MRKIEADVSNINSSTTQQLDVLQSKLLDLETRIINLERPVSECFDLLLPAIGTNHREFSQLKLSYRTLANIT